MLETKFDEQDLLNSVDEQCPVLSIGKKLANFIEVKKLNYQSVEEVPNSICDTFLENISICEKDIQYVESHTYGQHNNPNWHIARKSMITASNFRKVHECVLHNRNPPYLHKVLMGQYGDAKSPSLVWGLKKEKCAMNLYRRVAGKKHFCMTIENYGLHIYKDNPFLGCSIDGILKCKCKHHCGTKIIEIKCPYSDREKLPKEVALSKGCILDGNGNLQLTPNSEYFHQIQGQMGIYGCKFADLVIYTQQGIQVVEDIVFDESFFRDMIEKLEFYYKYSLLKKMIVNCNN